MADKIRMSDIRAKFPMYSDLPDDQLIIGVHRTYYPDIPIGQFTQRIEYDPAPAEKMGPLEKLGEVLTNAGAGAVRGAASIGATMVDAARGMGEASVRAASHGELPPSVKDNIGPQGADLRHAIDTGLQQVGDDANLPVDPNSLAYKGGKLGAEVAGTAGVGGALANTARAAGVAPAVVDALASGGMNAGGMAGARGVALRAGAGAANGAVSAGMVDPHAAGVGAVVGGAIPVAAQAVGTVARAAANRGATSVANDAQKMAAARAGSEAGYVVPPVDLKPGPMTQLISGLSGKIKTSQLASQRNQGVTDRLARQSLGLDDASELTADTLQQVRKNAGSAYNAVRGAGQVTADPAFINRLDQILSVSKGAARSFPGLKDNGVEDLITAVRQPTFDAGDAVDATMLLRDAADKAFRQGDTTLGRAAKGAANALEDQLQRHLEAAGNPDAVKAFQQARQQIAKSYTVQKALNPTTGSVSAPVLARELQKGKALSGELEQIAQFSQAFPKASQALKEAPGAVSPLDWAFAGGIGDLATLAARPLARAALLSKPAQALALRDPVVRPAIEQAMQAALPLSARAARVLLANP